MHKTLTLLACLFALGTLHASENWVTLLPGDQTSKTYFLEVNGQYDPHTNFDLIAVDLIVPLAQEDSGILLQVSGTHWDKDQANLTDSEGFFFIYSEKSLRKETGTSEAAFIFENKDTPPTFGIDKNGEIQLTLKVHKTGQGSLRFLWPEKLVVRPKHHEIYLKDHLHLQWARTPR